MTDKIMLRSPKIAARVFGWDNPGQIVRSTPRARFMFKAEFQPSDDANAMIYQAKLNDPTDIKSVAFKVKSIDKPRLNLNTVTLNHYNKKKIAYTKIDYNEASIRMYDTVDNSVLNLWINYFTFFFGDSRIKDTSAFDQGSVSSSFIDGTGWGLRPISANASFFKYITVYAVFGDTLTSFRYINPKITSIDWHDKDYSATDLEEVTISFAYEAIQYDLIGQPYKGKNFFEDGWLPTDTRDVLARVPNPVKSVKPRIFDNQIPTYNSTQLNVTQQNAPTVTPTSTAQLPSTFSPSQTPTFDFFTGGYNGYDTTVNVAEQTPVQTGTTTRSTTTTATTTENLTTWPADSQLWAASGLPDQVSSYNEVVTENVNGVPTNVRIKYMSSIQGPNEFGEYKVTVVSGKTTEGTAAAPLRDKKVASYVTKDPPSPSDLVYKTIEPPT